MKSWIPTETCLSCDVCCRFTEADSVWSPALLEDEIQAYVSQGLLQKAPARGRMPLVSNSAEGNHLCAFLIPESHQCRIYAERPLECQLYPFLLVSRGGKTWLALDPSCPYAMERLDEPGFQDVLRETLAFLTQPETMDLLRRHPHLFQPYENVIDLKELDLS